MQDRTMIRSLRLLALMAAAAGFCLLLPACGSGNGSNWDADADVPADHPADEAESIGEVPAEDIPHDPVQDETAGDTTDAAEAIDTNDTADVPADEAQEADAAELECTPPLIYHPGRDACVSTEGLWDDCTDSGCHTGQDCVTFTGIAGNEFNECNITCGPTPDRLCPEGYVCQDISDGPQNVCRPGD